MVSGENEPVINNGEQRNGERNVEEIGGPRPSKLVGPRKVQSALPRSNQPHNNQSKPISGKTSIRVN